MTTLFVSHSSNDKPIARKLATDLRNAHFNVWFDEWEIFVGDRISQKISQGLNQADFIVLLLSKHSIESGWVEAEWQSKIGIEASSRQIQILPVLLEKCPIPSLLKDKRYADMTGDKYRIAVRDLIRSINHLIQPDMVIESEDAHHDSNEKIVLLVDDEGAVRECMRNSLSKYSSELILYTAKDAGEGLRLFRQHKPDALILDLNMPFGEAAKELSAKCDGDMIDAGLRLLRKIRSDYPDFDFWCTIITSRARLEVIKELYKIIGERGKIYLKPFNMFEFEHELVTALEIQSQVPEIFR